MSSAPLADPELAALRDAELVLFPRRLEGFRPGWSWSDTDGSVQLSGLPPVAQALPSATLAPASDAEWLRSLEHPDFPIRLTSRVVEYLKFYRDTERGRAIARVWAKKVGRYTPALQAELTRFGLPTDLVWLSLIESGHNPLALSPAGAAGLWQFIPSSGRMYGLTVDRWVDERLDPRLATRAAARFLSDLHERFGTWELAMAAYNMGHAGLLRSVRKFNTNDFWRLAEYEAGIPWETALYVPKIFAIALVMNNRRAFGLQDIEPDPPVAFDTILVGPGIELSRVAKAAGVPVDAVRAMNPQYLRDLTPPSAGAEDSKKASGGREADARQWPVVLPTGTGSRALLALRGVKSGASRATYVARHGDTVTTIAHRTGMTEQALIAANGIGEFERLEPGTVLLVTKNGRYQPDQEPRVAVAAHAAVPEGHRVFYRVVSGDTLQSVARALRVDVRELVQWNELDPSAALQSEMVLSAYVQRPKDLRDVRLILPQHTTVLEAGSVPFIEAAEQEQGRRRIVVRAHEGETLAQIGRRHGLSAGMMERINRFSRYRKLPADEPVVVYTEHPTAEQPTAKRRPLDPLVAPAPRVLTQLIPER